MDLSGIDEESLELILALQLEDARNLTRGRENEGEQNPDSDVAVQMYQREIEALSSATTDRVLCRRLESAAPANVDDFLLSTHRELEAERQARQQTADRPGSPESSSASTPGLSENQDTPLVPTTPETDPTEPEADSDEITNEESGVVENGEASLEAQSEDTGASLSLVTGPFEENPIPLTVGEPSCKDEGSSEVSEIPVDVSTVECVACAEEIDLSQAVLCPCSHYYCGTCLVSFITASLADESMVPIRCCTQPIPVDENQDLLPVELFEQYEARVLEFGTLDRIYCHVATCSELITSTSTENDMATCVVCQSRTCVNCKGPFHEDEDCPEDGATQDVLRVAEEQRWQRCYQCNRMVELNEGCFHITCLCGAEFCYLCGQQWKTCHCPLFVAPEPLARPRIVVQRNVPEEDIPIRAERERTRQLRDNDDCNHVLWNFRHGENRCDDCGHFMPVFVWRCVRCSFFACRNCRNAIEERRRRIQLARDRRQIQNGE